MKHRSKRFLSILLSLALVLGLMPGMSLTALAETEQSETIATTAKTVNGTHFTISASNKYTDATNGVYGLDGGITVTPKNNEYITKVVITCGYRPSYVTNDRTTVSSGTMTITDGGGTITVTDVNASTFTFKCNSAVAMFNQFVVYYLDTYEVTYKVVNGTWSDDSTDDKTDRVPSGLKPTGVPTGMKAASGYTDGAWDTDPAEATITEATTFTYTFKQAATDTKAPTAKTLTSNGTPQPLVKPGSVEGGTMEYALGTDDKTPPTNGWSTSILTATEPGTYYVWYRVVGDQNHNGTDPACVVVTIEASDPKRMVIATMVSEGKTSLKLTWLTAEGVEGYDIFLKGCKQKGDCPLVGTVEGGDANSYTVTGLKKGVAYMAYVKAWVTRDGVKTYVLDQSPAVYAYTNKGTNKVTNPAKVTVKKAALTVKVGKSKKIKASVKGVKKGKKIIKKVRKLRYFSSDPSIATVNKKGKVKGRSAGSCVIYVLANNGKYKPVNVTVK